MNEHDKAAPSTGSFWAWVPALLLGSMLIGLGTLAYIAIDDPHFALEPNYYDKAVHWDQSQAESQRSRALGLQLVLRPLSMAADGKVKLELELKDRGGAVLPGASISLDAFPNAYASHVEQLLLRETAPGIYSGELLHGVRGLWELRFVVTQGTLRFSDVLRRDVTRGDAA